MNRSRLEPVQQLQPGAGVVGGVGVDWRRRRPPLISRHKKTCRSRLAGNGVSVDIDVSDTHRQQAGSYRVVSVWLWTASRTSDPTHDG